MPCRMRMRISSAVECPNWRAFRAAISTETAMSPAKPSLNGGGGNERTSVARFSSRKRTFNALISRLPVTSTVIRPRKPAVLQARAAKRSSACSLTPATRRFKMMVGRIRKRKKEGYCSCPPLTAILFLGFAQAWGALWLNGRTVSVRRPLTLEQLHLLFRNSRLVLVVSTDNALHQMMAHHVGFVKIHETQTLDVLQHIHRFQQSAAPGAGQIDLRNVASDDRLRIESQPRNEHFHLLGGRVLRFIQDHEGIVQCTAAHERNGR